MADGFAEVLNLRREKFDDFLERNLFRFPLARAEGVQLLVESIRYSLQGGGKRFRPLLCMLMAETFGVAPQRVLPWALAIEMIHTYSLIHDDLPCMDNDDFRRGQPTNHKKFGETTALLAGDALLTEAFQVIGEHYEQEAHIGLRLVQLLTEAAGLRGMVGGQALDLQAKTALPALQELNLLHRMKTGALIRVCTEGSAVILGLPEEKIGICRHFGECLGLAFQLKDDLLDSAGQLEPGSFPALLGLEETQNYLGEVSAEARATLTKLGLAEGLLHQLIIDNLQRER